MRRAGTLAGTIVLLLGVASSLLADLQPPPDGQPAGRGGRGGGRGAVRQRKAVLAWADTRNGIAQHDSVSHALAVIERLGYESGMYDTFIRTDSSVISKHPKTTDGKPASGGPSLANVDAIFFLGHREIQLDAEQKADLLAFVKEDGKGFVAGHTATTAFQGWPEFGELLGARYDGHPWNTVHGTVINEDPSFPATRHLPPSFEITEEFYQASEYSRDRIRVLLRLDVSKLPPNPSCTGPMATFRWRGRRATGAAACSTRPSATRPRRGTTRTSTGCISRRCAGRWDLPRETRRPGR